MPAKHTRHIALTKPLAEWVTHQIESGEYASASDLVRAAIRLLKEQGERKETLAPVVSPSSVTSRA